MSSNHHIRLGPILRPNCGNPKFPFFGDDNIRLDSFRNWRGREDIDLKSLVENGFFYTKDGDYVQCYVCGVVIGTWTSDMDPLLEHVRNSPSCRHLTKLVDPALLPEIKDQLFRIDIMRVPSNIPLERDTDRFTGHRVESTDQHSTGPPISAGHDGHGERHSGIIQQEQGPDAERNITVRGEFAGEPSRHPDSTAVNMGEMMNTPAAQSLLQNGYDQESVKRAIIDLSERGQTDLKGQDIAEVIHSREDFRAC